MRLRHIPGSEEFIRQSPHCLCQRDLEGMAGSWAGYFQNPHPLHIEIGMGKGRFIRQMALRYPHINFLGIERYESVLMKAIQRKARSMEEGVSYPNLQFLCMDARSLPECFVPGEVSRIYLNFSDLWPKKRCAKRRLTSPVFLALYDAVLAPEGRIVFKTDNRELFDYSLASISEQGWFLEAVTYDLHREEADNIMTEYEEKFSEKGQRIFRLIAGRKRQEDTCG